MRKADFKARIKKIELINRVLSDGWAQAIRVILDDIDLTNENLTELKMFKPNEKVFVEITPVQLSLFDNVANIDDAKNTNKDIEIGNLFSDENNDGEFVGITEGDTQSSNGTVIKEWKLG